MGSIDYPICPHCEETMMELHLKEDFGDGEFKEMQCENCSKLVGIRCSIDYFYEVWDWPKQTQPESIAKVIEGMERVAKELKEERHISGTPSEQAEE